MRYDPRFTRACEAVADAAPHLTSADVLAVVTAVLTETDRMLEEEADAHDLVESTGWPLCRPVAPEDVVPGEAVWDTKHQVFQFVDANPLDLDGEIVHTYAGGATRRYDGGPPALVALDNGQAEAWNRQRVADVSDGPPAYDWADDEHGGTAA
jgi:hypothetical protein